MKKRFLSAILVLSMIFSIIPSTMLTTSAAGYELQVRPATGRQSITAAAKAGESVAIDTTASKLEVSSLTIEFKNGKVHNLSVTTGARWTASSMTAMVVSAEDAYLHASAGSDDDDSQNDTSRVTITHLNNSTAAINTGAFWMPVFRVRSQATNIGTGQTVNLITNGSAGSNTLSNDATFNAEAIQAKATDDELGDGTISFSEDVSSAPGNGDSMWVRVYVCSSRTISGGTTVTTKPFVFDMTIPLNGSVGPITIPGVLPIPEGPTPEITSVTLDIDDPSQIGDANSGNNTSVTAVVPTEATISDITTTWNPTGTYAEGNNTATAVLKAPDGYIFASGVTINTADGWVSDGVSADGKTLTVHKVFNLVREPDPITSITATIDAPALKTVADTTAEQVKVNGVDAASTTVTITKWSDNASSVTGTGGAKWPKAGSGTYTATFTVTAPSTHKFVAGQTITATVANATSATATRVDDNTATVVATFPELDLLLESMTATPNTQTITAGTNYTVNKPDISLTYNDGSAESVTAGQYASKGITVDTTNIGGSSGQETVTSVGESHIGATRQITATKDGKSVTIERVTVVRAATTAVSLEMPMPIVGTTPASNKTVSVTDPTTGVEAEILNWYTAATGSTTVSGTLQYGQTYYVEVELTADDSVGKGYNFPTGTNALTVNMAAKSGTASNATLVDTSKTTTSANGVTAKARFAITMPTLTIAGSDSMDYYESSPTATVTVSNLATGDTITGVKLGSTTLAAADYTVSGGTITIKKSAMDKYLGTSHPSTLPKTAANADKLAVNVTTSAGGTVTGTTTAGYVGMYNTTPYLTVNATTSGKIAVDNGIRAAANTANTYALTKGTTYTVTATGDDVDHPFTSWSGGTLTGSTSPATFTAAASQTYTVGASFSATDKSFTVTKTGTGTVTVKNGSGTVITGSTTSFTTTYTVTPSQGPFTIEATPTAATKLTVLGTKTPVTATGDSIASIAYADLAANYQVTFVDKVLPQWTADTTAAGATHQLTMSRTDFVYKAPDTADYEYTGASVSPGATNPGSYSVTDNTYTLTPTVLDGLTAQTYTVTYTFRDKLYTSDRTKDKTLTRTFVITAAPTVKSVTLPTKIHGDNLGTFAFTITSNSVDTVYTYTASSDSWTKKVGNAAATAATTAELPAATVNVINGSTNKETAMSLTDFITKYVKTGTMVRRNALTGGTDNTLRNGDSIAVGLNGAYCTGAKLTVNPKSITLTVTGNNNFVKIYDGDDNVTDTLTLATTDTKVGTDNVNFTDNNQMRVTGKYASKNASATAQNITFTVNPNTTSNPDLANYTITATGTTGTINKRPITIAASKFNGQISSAAYNTKPTGQSGTLAGVKTADLSAGTIATPDNTAGISIAFKYSYDDTTGTSVTIDEAKCEPNYAITVTGKATGARQERTVSTIVITPKKQGGADSTSFYSSDKIDATIVVNYTDGVDPDTYNTIDAAKAAGVTVTWNDNAAISSGQALTVASHNGKNIKATYKTKTGNSSNLTVKKIPVKVTVNANKIEKVYDSDNTFNSSTDTVTPSFTYVLSVDTAQVSAGSTAADYNDDVAGITGDGATVTFAQSNVYHATYGGSTTYDDVAKATNGTISNTNEFTVTSTVSNIKEAEITKFPLTIKQIDYIKSVYVGSAGTYSGTAALKRTATNEANSDYEALATFNETMPNANDKVQLDISYDYDNTTAATANNAASVTLHSITLAAASGSNQNANYSFTAATDADNIPGKGTVKDRAVNTITLTLPDAFTKDASGNAIVTYGTAPYDFKAADYAGLKVVVNYVDGGTTTYTWKDNSGSLQWEVKEESLSAAWQPDFTKVPFTLKWSNGGLSAAANVSQTEEILWTTNKSGRTMTAAIGAKSNAKTVTVNPKEIKVAAGHDKPVKNYDKTTTIVPAGTWTWTPSDKTTDSSLAVTLASGKSVTYSSANASASDIDLRFDGKAYNATNLTPSFTITVDGDTDGSRAGSYKITEITGTTKGTIKKRPITLEAINNVKSVNQFSTPADATGSAASNASGSNPKSVFAAAGGDDTAGTGTGILSGDTITVSYSAKYADTSVAGAVSEAAATALTSGNLQLKSVTQANANYEITNAAGPFARTGSITAAKVQSITITAPSMFGKTTTQVQYGDTFSYDGLAVTLAYPSATETYKPKTYDTNGAITEWEKEVGTTKTTMAAADIPFDLAWTTTSYNKGDSLKVDTAGTDKLKATLKSGVAAEAGVSSAQTTTGLVVGKRLVVPTPATTGVTKTYDGNTTYAASNGAITYTVAAGTATSYTPAGYALPTALNVTSASYAYDNLNATHATRTGATKINITNMALGGTDDATSNYVLTTTSGNVAATITKRDVTITQIERIAAINQGSAISKVTNYAVTTNTTASPRAIVDSATPVATRGVTPDVLDLVVDYTYSSSAVAGNNTIAVTIENLKAKSNSDTDQNYNVSGDPDGLGTVTALAVTLTVTNPTILDANYTFGTALNLAGLKVNVKYGTTGTGTTYAWQSDGSWSDGTNTYTYANLPFTLAYTGVKGGASTTITDGAQLPPANYNGSKITATLKQIDSSGTNPTGSGAAITVKKKPIANIDANLATDDVSKVYNGNTTLSAADLAKLSYNVTASEFVTGYEETFAVAATPAYVSKDAANDIDITFTGAGFATGATSANYEFAATVTVNEKVAGTAKNIEGDITKATITVTDVNVPSITVDNTISTDHDVVVTNRGSAATASASNVAATGIVTGEANYIQFDYTIVYRQADANGSSGVKTDLFVTLKNQSAHVTAQAAANNVKLENYDVVWTPVTNRSTNSAGKASVLQYTSADGNRGDYLLGQVADDTYTLITITANVPEHTHGDKLDLRGLQITIKSENNYTSNTTFVIEGEPGAQHWKNNNSGDTVDTLPTGVTVELNGYDLSSTDSLDKLQAHHINMNGKNFVLAASPVVAGTDASKTAGPITVKKKELTYTYDPSEDLDKYYDGNRNVTQAITYTPTAGDIVTFAKTSYTDKVTIKETSTPVYATANVQKVGEVVSAQAITFSIAVDGTDKDNYTITAPTGVTGKIMPRTVVVTSFNANRAADAIYQDSTTATGSITANGSLTAATTGKDYKFEALAAEGTWPTGLAAPAIKIDYDYGNKVNTIADPVAIPVTKDSDNSLFTVAFNPATNNFTLQNEVTTLEGRVKTAGITKIVIAKTQTTYTYGDKLSVTENLDDLNIKLYSGETKVIADFNYSDGTKVNDYMSDYNLKLEILNNSAPYATLLKSGAGTIQVIEDTAGGAVSNAINLTIEKRKLLVQSTDSIDKTYDGDNKVDRSSVTLNVAEDAGQSAKSVANDPANQYGLIAEDKALRDAPSARTNEDAFEVTNPVTMTYASKNASATAQVITPTGNAVINPVEGLTIDMTQYIPVIDTLEGIISPKEVELTPAVRKRIVAEDSGDITGALPTAAGENTVTVDTTKSFVTGEDSKYNLSYTIKISDTERQNVGSKTFAPQDASANPYASNAAAEDSKYAWQITSTDATNNPLTNYNFTWNDAKFTVYAGQAYITDITIDGPGKLDYEHLDILDLHETVITVTYNDGRVVEYTYNDSDTWDVKETVGDNTEEKAAVNAPEDITVTWANTGSSEVEYKAVMGYLDTDKGYTDAGDKKMTYLTATATLTKGPGSTEYASASSDDQILVAKKQLKLATSGFVEKVYDGNAVIGQSADPHTGQSDELKIAVQDKYGNAISGITFDRNNAIRDGIMTFVSTTVDEEDEDAGDNKKIAIDLTNIGDYLLGTMYTDNTGAFELPTLADDDNKATGKINGQATLIIKISGTAKKVFDTHDTLVKIDGDDDNTYALTIELIGSNGAVEQTLTGDEVDALVTNEAITYKDLREGTPDSYAGTSEADEPEKTLKVDLTEFAKHVTLEEAVDALYDLPTSTSNVTIAEDAVIEITPRPITFVATTESIKTLSVTDEIKDAGTYRKNLTAAEYVVYDGQHSSVPDDSTDTWDITGVIVTWTITYDIDNIDWTAEEPVSDIDWGKDVAGNADPHTLTEAPAANYAPYWLADQAKVKSVGNTYIKIITPPTAEKAVYGEPTDWTDFEFEVSKDGVVTKHKWDKDAEDWVEDGTYTKPTQGTTFKWNDDEPTTDVPPVDATLKVGDNIVTITDPDIEDSESSAPIVADKKELIIVVGEYSKPYDGSTTVNTNNPEEDPEAITITLKGIVDGDVVTFTKRPELNFTDKNVSLDEDGNVIAKEINVTDGGILDEESAKNYTIKLGEVEHEDGTETKIVKKQLTVKIKDRGTSTSNTTGRTEQSNVGFSETVRAGKYTIENVDEATKQLITAENVTLSYTGTYPLPMNGGNDQVITLEPENMATVDGTNAKNYEIVRADATGDVSVPAPPGGGGGNPNKLTIHYEKSEGVPGDEVERLEAMKGDAPVDLIGKFLVKLKDPTVIWTSADPEVATVDENGIVTFVGKGETVITAVSVQNKSLKDTVKVIVDEIEVPPTPTPTPKPIESLLTKDMLNPYIIGYDDYVFGPELPISREELAAIFARLIANNIYMDKDYDTSFPDVPITWSRTYIGYLEGFNVVTGYEDGTFRPHNYITRAEMAVMMAKAEGYDISGYLSAGELPFPDVDDGYSTWAVKAIKILTDRGIMEGYTDGTFRPGQPITRAETVATVNRVLYGMEVVDFEVLPSDVTDAHWAYNDIVFAMNHRVLKDVAADPDRFIWSEQFDQNMTTITEKVSGGMVYPSEDNSSGGDEPPKDDEETSE